MKLKTCKLCKEDLPLTSYTSTRAFYCNNCRVVRKLTQQKEMQQRAFDRLTTKKQKAKGVIRVSDLKKKVQKVFNKWIRERDADLPCLACQQHKDKYDASHYASQGSSGYLRYHPDNVWNTCSACNRFKHGNLISYRENLVKKIGKERVLWIEENRRKTHKYTREQLDKIIDCCKRNTMSVECWYETMHKV